MMYVTGDHISYVRGYEALSKTASEAGLKAPQKITSVSLRKYMATVAQVITSVCIKVLGQSHFSTDK